MAAYAVTRTKVHFKDIGIEHHIGPAYSDMVSYSSRLLTFDNRNWPGKVTGEQMADAGLFYLGFGDYCRCFYCGITLIDFREKDIPW